MNQFHLSVALKLISLLPVMPGLQISLAVAPSFFFYGELGQCCSAATHLVTKLRDLFTKAVPKQLLCYLFYSLSGYINTGRGDHNIPKRRENLLKKILHMHVINIISSLLSDNNKCR